MYDKKNIWYISVPLFLSDLHEYKLYSKTLFRFLFVCINYQQSLLLIHRKKSTNDSSNIWPCRGPNWPQKMPKMAKYRSKMSLITRRITGGFVVHWDFFPLIMPSSTFIFSSSIIFQRLFGEIQNYPGKIQEYFWITKKKL